MSKTIDTLHNAHFSHTRESYIFDHSCKFNNFYIILPMTQNWINLPKFGRTYRQKEEWQEDEKTDGRVHTHTVHTDLLSDYDINKTCVNTMTQRKFDQPTFAVLTDRQKNEKKTKRWRDEHTHTNRLTLIII